MTVAHLAPGHLLGGRYEILATLGKGGMGVVYKAHDRVLNETVAIKVLRQDLADAPDMTQRFLAEIKLARSVSHRNVCRIHEYGQDGDLRYISMAYVEGVDLKQVIRERGPLPPAEAYDIAIGVADGLQAIHDEGIVHRDLKTPNLMVDGRGLVRLMDFGIAKQWADKASASLTGTGMIVGTPEYMSPEQVLGKKLDARSDLYSLGIVIYELFTGQTPFESETPVGLLMKHLQEPPPLVGERARGLPPELVPVVARALAKERDERFSSAHEMAEALREVRRQTLPTSATGAAAGGARPLTAIRPAVQPITVRPGPTAPSPVATEALRVLPEEAPSPTLAATASGWAVTAPRTVARRAPAPPPRPGRGRLVYVALLGLAACVLGLAVALVMRRPGVAPSSGPASAPPPVVSPPIAAPAPDTPAASMAAAPSTVPPVPVTTTPAAPHAAVASAPAPAARGGPSSTVPPQVEAEVDGLIVEAESAFSAQQYAAALAFYDQALKLHPASERARVGRELCASAMARAAAAPPRPAHAFVSGHTERSGQPPAASGPSGFESSSGVAVQRVDVASGLAGKLYFEVRPEAVKPGDAFTVDVFLVNEGAAVLAVSDVVVETTVNGLRSSGSVAPLVRSVTPRQRALLVSVSGQWGTDTRTWSMAVSVRTGRGESFRNQVEWR